MRKTVEVQIETGVIVLTKPKAGVRNKALMKSETGEGLKQTTFLVELIPYCIESHPFGTVPVREALDNLEIDDYDKIMDGFTQLMSEDKEKVKKLNEPSGQESTPKTSV